MTTMKLAVVIPFFQRSRGLLEAAVASVAAQQLGPEVAVEIIIVDDGSPIAAATETLATLPAHWSLRIIEQANAGVSRARNTALDAVSSDTKYVAFLDSDDVWFPHHLTDAIRALEAGASFYFSNYRGERRDFFSHRPYMMNFFSNKKNSLEEIFYVSGSDFLFHILQEYIAHTSFIVYNFLDSKDIRFNEELKFSSEDHLFWILVVARAEQVAFSKKVGGRRYSGVSLFGETTNWNSPNILNRIIDQMIFQEILKSKFPENVYSLKSYEEKMNEHVGGFVFIFSRLLLRRPLVSIRAFFRLSTKLPSALLLFPNSLLNLRTNRDRLIKS